MSSVTQNLLQIAPTALMIFLSGCLAVIGYFEAQASLEGGIFTWTVALMIIEFQIIHSEYLSKPAKWTTAACIVLPSVLLMIGFYKSHRKDNK